MSFLRARFISFAMLGGVFFLLLVSLTIEALLKGFSRYVQQALPGGLAIALSVYLVFDFAVVVLLFAMIFKFLPDANIQWRDVWIGSVMTAIFFGVGKWALGLYLGSGAAASAYGAASSLITLLLWIYYSAINTGHGAPVPPKRITIGRAEWRRHGFVSLDAGPEGGEVETQPLQFDSAGLVVNADAGHGELRVAVLEADGRYRSRGIRHPYG